MPPRVARLTPEAVHLAPEGDQGPRVLGGVPGAMLARIQAGRDTPHSYLLLLRFSIVNFVAMALLTAAWLWGWVDMVLAADRTGLSLVIFAVFLGGLVISTRKAVQISRDLNFTKEFDPPRWSRVARYLETVVGRGADSRAICASTLRLKLSARIGVVRGIANSLVLLGLIGTVVGFIIALSGVEPEAVSDVKAVAPMVSTLIQGMSVALYTTLVGAVLNIWLTVNYQILVTGTANLIAAIVELGESHAGA